LDYFGNLLDTNFIRIYYVTMIRNLTRELHASLTTGSPITDGNGLLETRSMSIQDSATLKEFSVEGFEVSDDKLIVYVTQKD